MVSQGAIPSASEVRGGSRLGIDEVGTVRLRSDSQVRHLFVDNVRFLSMFAIVLVHGMGVFDTDDSSIVFQTLQTPLKFGTVGFFLISGFLLGERVRNCEPMAYLGRRLKKVFVPWLVWLSLLATYQIVLDVIRHRVHLTLSDSFPLFLRQCESCLLSTSFWFVPNLLLALVILLVFRRHLYDLRLGAALLLLKLFYVVNIYKLWVPSSHLEALLGFVFDLWLGSYASGHRAQLEEWVAKIRTVNLASLVVGMWFVALAETRLLTHLHSPDPLNTLRISNQVFSLLAVLLIFKSQRAIWPAFVNVRRETFGIYLTHAMFLAICINLMNIFRKKYAAGHRLETNVTGVLIWVLVSTVVYVGCLAMSRALANESRLRWLVGAGPD